MVLVTGPTGSGKTTTLYSALSELNKIVSNISTAEDPVEYNLVGINQVQIHEDIGLNFANALRAFLRQDPDIIMVGEMRDFETAEIAIKAALTGHLVLSTLHTNDAPSTINRLLNMGVEPFLVASSVNLVLAQRLARVICSGCKEPVEVQPQALIELGMSTRGGAHRHLLPRHRLPAVQRHRLPRPRRALRGDADERGAARACAGRRVGGRDQAHRDQRRHDDAAPERPAQGQAGHDDDRGGRCVSPCRTDRRDGRLTPQRECHGSTAES